MDLRNKDYTVEFKPGDLAWKCFLELIYSMQRVPMHDYDSDSYVLKRPGDVSTADMPRHENVFDCVNKRNFRLVIAFRTPDYHRTHYCAN